ncbi:MAG: hypothetical protein GX664_08765, partial [Bacteroidales bacterium]|nr:hypothetical protein [Bacteroidales bacterium]
LTSLDVSHNTALTFLDCNANQLTSLELPTSTALTTLYCYDNRLPELDVTNNPELSILICGNQMTSDGLLPQILSLTLHDSKLDWWNSVESININVITNFIPD